MAATHNQARPPEVIRSIVAHLVASVGEVKVGAQLNISRLTVVRIMAGLPVKLGTIALVEKRLAEAGTEAGP